MGKFADVLTKSQGHKRRAWSKTPAKEPPKEQAKQRTETIDALRLDATALQEQAELPPLVGENNLDPRLKSFIDPHSITSECFRLLRARILSKDEQSRPRSIMVTSPQPMDGKTIVAANLAVSIARGINEHVMLVDCDLRYPDMHRLLGLDDRSEGIREYLETGTTVAPYLWKTPVKKLTLLPAGQLPPNPSELLSSEKMRHLVRELKSRYDDRYIIFDATPAQFAAETTFLASMVDGVLLVVRSGKTANDVLLEAMENVGHKKILGVVFNFSQEGLKGYKHYDRYYRKGQK